MISRKALLPLVLSLACFGMTSASAEQAKYLCTGQGEARLSAGLSYYPTVAVNVQFEFTFLCADGGSVTGRGTLATASCGRSSGIGRFDGYSDKPFTIETAGSMLAVMSANGIIGAGNATPIPDTATIPFSNSCSNGTAHRFHLVGFVCSPQPTAVDCQTG